MSCGYAFRVQYDELKPRLVEAELVATLPPGVPGIAWPTGQVLHEMLLSPVREVILLGYELTESGIMKLLVEATSGGGDVIMICDRERESARRILEKWREDERRPRIFHDRERADVAP